MDDRYLSLKELSIYSSLSASTLRSLLSEIPHTTVGRKVIVRRSEFDAWLRRRKIEHERVSPFTKKMLDKIFGKTA